MSSSMLPGTPPTTPDQPAPLSSYSWYVLALLFVSGTLNNIDRHMVAALAEPLKLEFQLGDSQIGFLSGLAFAIAYTVFGLPLGLLIDRLRRAPFLAALMAIWSVATVTSGMVGSFFGLAAARIAVAGSEAGGSPLSVSLIGDFFPEQKRGLAIGIYYAHTAVASFLAFTLGGFLAAAYGWRVAFFAAGAPGLLLALLVLVTLREPPRADSEASGGATRSQPTIRQTLRALVSNRILLSIAVAATLMVAGISATMTFTAAFFARSHHLSLSEAGALTGMIAAIAYGFGNVGGGFLSDWASKRSRGGGCIMVAILSAIATPVLGVAFFLPAIGWAVALMALGQLLVTSFLAASFAAVFREAPVTLRGAVTSVMMILMNLGGFGLGPQLAGAFSDIFAAAGWSQPLSWGLLVSTTIFFGSSSIMYLFIGREVNKASALDK